jgi:hypothetical protein
MHNSKRPDRRRRTTDTEKRRHLRASLRVLRPGANSLFRFFSREVAEPPSERKDRASAFQAAKLDDEGLALFGKTEGKFLQRQSPLAKGLRNRFHTCTRGSRDLFLHFFRFTIERLAACERFFSFSKTGEDWRGIFVFCNHRLLPSPESDLPLSGVDSFDGKPIPATCNYTLPETSGALMGFFPDFT